MLGTLSGGLVYSGDVTFPMLGIVYWCHDVTLTFCFTIVSSAVWSTRWHFNRGRWARVAREPRHGEWYARDTHWLTPPRLCPAHCQRLLVFTLSVTCEYFPAPSFERRVNHTVSDLVTQTNRENTSSFHSDKAIKHKHYSQHRRPGGILRDNGINLVLFSSMFGFLELLTEAYRALVLT